jgi:signal transduction histidine kinase
LKPIRFTVDSALLKELGERLVGKPHIALAELIKNAYDADASRVVLRFGADKIEVIDNGHGMTFDEFRGFWMRIGTPHKQSDLVSRRLKRPLTGSKGIGRLAVQFLARKLNIVTATKSKTEPTIQATVNWDEAVNAGELTKAEARYETLEDADPFPGGSRSGTKVTLRKLNQSWGREQIVELAREIWTLQSPFKANPELKTEDQRRFEVELESPGTSLAKDFRKQMRAYLNIWHARISGGFVDDAPNPDVRRVQISVLFDDGSEESHTFKMAPCRISAVDFEIRVYSLAYKQKFGIRVDEARDYLKNFGGVHIYDAGFHLPYYGPQADWLDIEIDHSHRLSTSDLLPEDLQVSEGLNFLPTQSRLFGVVNVSTAGERETWAALEKSPEYLQIQISRDRLVDNSSYQHLKKLVRWSLDFYAMAEARRALAASERFTSIQPTREKIDQAEHVLEQFKSRVPAPVYDEIKKQLRSIATVTEQQAESLNARVGLLGALATAGAAALAFEHEFNKQLRTLRQLIEDIRSIEGSDSSSRKRISAAADALSRWVDTTKATRGLFLHLLDEDNREKRVRLKAGALMEQMEGQLKTFLRGIDLEVDDLDPGLRLPLGTFAEWSAVFQNVVVNAINAMLDSKVKRIRVRSSASGLEREVFVEDTGVGVDLDNSLKLFAPFVRDLELSQERKQLGIGGSGLGLAIVKMITDSLGCQVSFVSPRRPFATSFRIFWREQE